MREAEFRWSPGVRGVLPAAFAALVMLAASGCHKAKDVDAESEVDSTLAALMADGPLPAGMQPGEPVPPEPPPRFCDFNPLPDGGIEDDAGGPDPMPADGGTGVAGFPGPVGGGGSPIPGIAGAPAPSPVPPFPFPGGRGGSMQGPGGGCESVPIGFWRFDDCNARRTELQDSSDERHTAFRSVDLQCTASQQGLGATFARKGDLVYAPDQPAFSLSEGVTVAAWVNPDGVNRTQTLFRKRDGKSSAIALVIDDKKFKFIVRLTSGKIFSVAAPAEAGLWTHVAGTYDGSYLRLYKNGAEVRSSLVTGTIERGVGPLLMGNDIDERRLHGSMDSAWFNTLAAPPETILQLTCIQRPPSVSVTPEVGPTVAPGTTVPYTLSVTNNSPLACGSSALFAFASGFPELSVSPSFAPFLVPSGETASLTFEVTSAEETEPGDYPVTFQVGSSFFPFGDTAIVEATYVVGAQSGCHVLTSRALTIRHVSVVDDPIRTSMDGQEDDPRTGAWTFGRLMERLSPTPADAPDVTEDMFRTFTTTQTINGFTVEPRFGMLPFVLDPWPRTPDGKLDLARAPMRLLAIVNRLDLKNLEQGKAGEGRIVFGVLEESGFPLEFTVIFEYLLPADDEAEFREWADAFHALQSLPFPSEQYNDALQAITDRFTARNAAPGLPNGNLLIDIRTNEIALGGPWELREFRISEATGFMQPFPIFLTPDSSFNFSDRLARFINANEASILTETHIVPETFEGEPFLGGAVFNNIDFWDAPGVESEARHKFSLNTCNGCHGAETNSAFLQIFPRFAGEQSQLAGFQTGITVFDPVTGEPRRLAELARRRALLESVVCEGEP